jgi:hypothetical protein
MSVVNPVTGRDIDKKGTKARSLIESGVLPLERVNGKIKKYGALRFRMLPIEVLLIILSYVPKELHAILYFADKRYSKHIPRISLSKLMDYVSIKAYTALVEWLIGYGVTLTSTHVTNLLNSGDCDTVTFVVTRLNTLLNGTISQYITGTIPGGIHYQYLLFWRDAGLRLSPEFAREAIYYDRDHNLEYVMTKHPPEDGEIENVWLYAFERLAYKCLIYLYRYPPSIMVRGKPQIFTPNKEIAVQHCLKYLRNGNELLYTVVDLMYKNHPQKYRTEFLVRAMKAGFYASTISELLNRNYTITHEELHKIISNPVQVSSYYKVLKNHGILPCEECGSFISVSDLTLDQWKMMCDWGFKLNTLDALLVRTTRITTIKPEILSELLGASYKVDMDLFIKIMELMPCKTFEELPQVLQERVKELHELQQSHILKTLLLDSVKD